MNTPEKSDTMLRRNGAWRGKTEWLVLELWGSTAAVRYADGRLVVSPLRAGDDNKVDAALADLHAVMLVLSDDGDGVLLLHLRSPEFPVGGVANLRCPVSVHVGADGLEAAKTFVTTVNADLLELRRVRPAERPPVAPAPVPSPQGPRRADVDAAADRMRHSGRRSGGLISKVHALCQAEPGCVLELASAGFRGGTGVVVATTTRLLFVSERAAQELPLEALEWVQVTWRPGALWVLQIADGGTGLEFTAQRRDDFDRVAAAVRYSCELQRAVGAIGPPSPSVVDLFAEWQTLLERHQLGMVPDDQFERQAFGLLLAVSGD
jgi:hypothetical protein